MLGIVTQPFSSPCRSRPELKKGRTAGSEFFWNMKGYGKSNTLYATMLYPVISFGFVSALLST